MLPTDTYIRPSGPNSTVRVEWPPPPGRSTSFVGAALAFTSPALYGKRTTPSVFATYRNPPRMASPCGWFSPLANTCFPSAFPSRLRSGRTYTIPAPVSLSRTSPLLATTMKRGFLKPSAYRFT